MIRPTALAAVLLASVPAAASAEPPAPGIYSNVVLSAETGDLGGAELQLFGADARVEFVLCEGWCNEIKRAPVRFTADGLEFSYVESYFDQDGRPAGDRMFHASAARRGTGVKITITPADTPDFSFSFMLEPAEERFGLAVAAGED